MEASPRKESPVTPALIKVVEALKEEMPETLKAPPMRPAPEVSKAPDVVVATPTPIPPTAYMFPAPPTANVWPGEVVPTPTFPPASTINEAFVVEPTKNADWLVPAGD